MYLRIFCLFLALSVPLFSFKLKDSDLVGIPYKVIVGKSFKESGNLEVESRLGEKLALAPEEISSWAKKAFNI